LADDRIELQFALGMDSDHHLSARHHLQSQYPEDDRRKDDHGGKGLAKAFLVPCQRQGVYETFAIGIRSKSHVSSSVVSQKKLITTETQLNQIIQLTGI
jgi:hypothetical protein